MLPDDTSLSPAVPHRVPRDVTQASRPSAGTGAGAPPRTGDGTAGFEIYTQLREERTGILRRRHLPVASAAAESLRRVSVDRLSGSNQHPVVTVSRVSKRNCAPAIETRLVVCGLVPDRVRWPAYLRESTHSSG